MAFKTSHGDRDVKRAPVDSDLEALAVSGPVPGTGSDSATVAGVGQVDPGQVAQGVRDQDGYLVHADVRAGMPAGRAELRWDYRQVPADGLTAAVAGQHIALFFQAYAGVSVALGVPVKLVPDLVTVRRAPIRWQQLKQSPLVLAGLVLGLPHADNLAGHPDGRSKPIYGHA